MDNDVLKVLNNIETLLIDLKSKKVESRSDLTYAEWSLSWLENYKKPKCKTNYYIQLCRYVAVINGYIGKKKIGDITPLELQSFLSNIKSDCTRCKYGAVLSDSFRRAKQNRLIDYNPYLGVDYNRYDNPRLGALSHQQQLELLQFPEDPERKALTMLLLLTGLRQGEALALTWSDFDFDRMEINVDKSVERQTNAIVKPKTKSSVRRVPFDTYLIDCLKVVKGKKMRLFNMRSDSCSKYYSRLFKKLGYNFSGHILRHTFITNMYEAGVPPYNVQRWVGHSKLEQAQVYLDLRKSKCSSKNNTLHN